MTCASGRRQYSQRPAARCRTSSLVASSIPGTSWASILERFAGLQVKEREHVANLDIPFEFLPFLTSQAPFLVFPCKVVHAGLVPFAERELEEGASGRARKPILLGLDESGPDSEFGGCGLGRGHYFSLQETTRAVYHEARRS